MSSGMSSIVMYVFFWAIRVNGCIRRGLQPMRRGREWFFDVHVTPEFYNGAGRKLLHQYWTRMLLPFALDIPIAAYLFVSHHLRGLNWLMVALVPLIYVNHCFNVNLAQRQARRLAPADIEQPVARVQLSLTPRRLRDYSNAKVEWVLALSSAFALALLLRYYRAAPEHHNLRLVFGFPMFLLYLQFGMVFVKRVVLAWRTLIPQEQAAEHIRAREETRKYYLRVCDWQRAALTAALLFWPIRLSTPPPALGKLIGGWFIFWMLINVVSFVWIEIRRQQLLNLAVQARPVNLPDFLHPSEIVKWPLCYQPSVPTLVVEGARGYSLNFANALTQLGAAYIAGFIMILMLLRVAL